MISMICLLGLELKHSYLLALLCLHGNMFVKIISSIQYQVIKQSADDAFYELQNPAEQINLIFLMVNTYFFSSSYITRHGKITRSRWIIDQNMSDRVPRMTLDQLFEQKNEVAKTVLEELERYTLEIIYVHGLWAYKITILSLIDQGYPKL
uniref:Putative stomatin family n=1 Tax=Helianthus annuus TaxID=4232 RepID=A0A251SDI2_HELAN